MRIVTLLMITTLLLGGCATFSKSESAENPRYARNELDPEQMPKQIDLYKAQSVLRLTFEVSASGYRLISYERVNGVPTSTIDTGRDVIVTALDANSKTVSQVSVQNPREIHTAGSRKPEMAVLDRARFSVAFSNPERITRVSIQVLRGPNVDHKQVFDLKPSR